MNTEELKQLFEDRYINMFGKPINPVWNSKFEDSVARGVMSKEVLEEYAARGLVYVDDKVDAAWRIFECGFWNGATVESYSGKV